MSVPNSTNSNKRNLGMSRKGEKGYFYFLLLLAILLMNMNCGCVQKEKLPLIEAVKKNDAKAILALLDSGAKVNEREKKTGRSPLIYAVVSNRIVIAELLLEEVLIRN